MWTLLGFPLLCVYVHLVSLYIIIVGNVVCCETILLFLNGARTERAQYADCCLNIYPIWKKLPRGYKYIYIFSTVGGEIPFCLQVLQQTKSLAREITVLLVLSTN